MSHIEPVEAKPSLDYSIYLEKASQLDQRLRALREQLLTKSFQPLPGTEGPRSIQELLETIDSYHQQQRQWRPTAGDREEWTMMLPMLEQQLEEAKKAVGMPELEAEITAVHQEIERLKDADAQLHRRLISNATEVKNT